MKPIALHCDAEDLQLLLAGLNAMDAEKKNSGRFWNLQKQIEAASREAGKRES